MQRPLSAFSALLCVAIACTSRAPEPAKPRASDTPAVAAEVSAAHPYFEFQVDKPVTQLPGGAHPSYPPELRTAKVQGQVLAQFIVDENGHYVPGSYKVLRSEHALFSDAVASVLPTLSFRPAVLGGKNVSQLVQQPFVFSLAP